MIGKTDRCLFRFRVVWLHGGRGIRSLESTLAFLASGSVVSFIRNRYIPPALVCLVVGTRCMPQPIGSCESDYSCDAPVETGIS